MKTIVRFFFFLLVQFLLISHAAAENGNLIACKDDLRNLLIHALPPDSNNATLYPTFTERNDSKYMVKLYVPVPDGDVGPGGREMTMGWVKLDTAQYTAYDVAGEEPKKLPVDVKAMHAYVAKCLSEQLPARQPGDEVLSTRLPIRLAAILDCYDADVQLHQCIDHYHEYPIDWIDADIRKSFDPWVKSFFLLPPLEDLKVVLASGHANNALYVFKNGKLLSKEVVGKSTNISDFSFDINKDYLVTTYLRMDTHITRETKISEVRHEKLGLDGKFVECPKSNPACK